MFITLQIKIMRVRISAYPANNGKHIGGGGRLAAKSMACDWRRARASETSFSSFCCRTLKMLRLRIFHAARA